MKSSRNGHTQNGHKHILVKMAQKMKMDTCQNLDGQNGHKRKVEIATF